MALAIPYAQWWRRLGVRRISLLLNPKVNKIEKFVLPKGVTYHYMGDTETEVGPSLSNPIVVNAPRLVFIDHVKEMTSHQGNPKPTYVLAAPLIQKYRRLHMSLRPMMDYDQSTKDLLNTVVVNYAILPKLFKYMRSFRSGYWRWFNIYRTKLNKIESLKSKYERHQFMEITLSDIPSIATLRKGETNLTREVLKRLPTVGDLEILDLWTWLGPNRHMSSLSLISDEQLATTHIILKRNHGWVCLNLGVMDSWRARGKVSLENDSPLLHEGASVDLFYSDKIVTGSVLSYSPESSVIQVGDETMTVMTASFENAANGLDPKALQLRFYAFLLRVVGATNLVTQPAETTQPVASPQGDHGSELSDEPEDPNVDAEDAEAELRILMDTGVDDLLVDEETDLDESLDEDGTVPDDVLMTDEDGELVEVSGIEEAGAGTIAVGTEGGEETGDDDLTTTIARKSQELVDKRLYTAAEARRMERLAESYKRLQDPWGSGNTIEEQMVITQEDLILDRSEVYPDHDSILDESMRSSSVEKMDSQYITKVMNKDILNMVMSVQKAGVAVTGYKVSEFQDAVSHYEVHTVQLTPVLGKPSTITFRVPKVDKRGVYISNGVRSRTRSQKADIPIRKTKPTQVALSSYYGKIFVNRSQRSTFNYDKWVTNQIVAAGLDTFNKNITNLRITNVADYSKKLPAIYSTISSRIASFEAGGGKYWFDINRREKSGIFDSMDAVLELEKTHPGMVVCGRKDGKYILVDIDDTFYTTSGKAGGDLDPLGGIEDITGIPMDKTPVSMAEISLFGKDLPIGVAIGYLLGWKGLIKRLNPEHRVVNLGERLTLSDDEFAVRFLDISYVFKKTDPMACLVFGGFNQYHKTIKNYSAHAYDSKEVYFSILDQAGIGLRYLREMDLMNAMFIDPITRSILEWMKEPTSFIPLMFRACEMLITRHVPSRVEGAEGVVDGLERTKGYERIPGAIYSELIHSIRVYNSRSASSNSQVTMNPHDVWVAVVQDSAAAPIDDINPVQNLKQKEIVTYGGRGGRSSRSMTAETRLYREADLGYISEGTVDSGDVAVITYMSPNANLTSVRGTVRAYNPETDGATTLLSTSALISPCSDRDDPKRVSLRLHSVKGVE